MSNGEPPWSVPEPCGAYEAYGTPISECPAYKALASRLDKVLELLRRHGIHIEEMWCWCNPTIESHADSADEVQKP